MNKNQKGFSAVEGLLILVIIGIIGVVGWYVVNSKDKTNKTYDNSTQSQAEPPKVTEKHLEVKSWNIHIPVTGKLSDLEVMDPMPSSYSSHGDEFANIMAPALDKNWKCEADSDGMKGTIGSISRTTQVKRDGPYEPLVTKKVGKYNYGFEKSGSNCTKDPLYQELVDEFKLAFKNLIAD